MKRSKGIETVQVSMHELVEQETGVDFEADDMTFESAKQAALDAGVPAEALEKLTSVGEAAHLEILLRQGVVLVG